MLKLRGASIVQMQRYFSSGSMLRNSTSLPPTSAPTATENDEWLNQLSVNAEEVDFATSPDKSYILSRVGGQEGAEGKGCESWDTMGDKLKYKIYGFDENEFLDVGLPVSNFYIKSSPFSHLSSKNKPKADNNQSFSDLRLVRLKAGKGGDGVVSFLRDAGRAIGPPDGGDGGDGGTVFIQAVEGMSSLHTLKQSYSAKEGKNGAASQLDGKRGEDIVISVPIGTTIRWIPDPKLIRELQNEEEEQIVKVKGKGDYEGDNYFRHIQFFRNSYKPGEGWLFKDREEQYHLDREFFQELNKRVKIYDRRLFSEEIKTDIFPSIGIDLNKPSKDPIPILHGGKGGMGNMHFLTKNIRNPRFSKKGRSAIEENFIFELKLLADLGLVGLPNSGKSTLLRAISNARPKVGHWAFTTLRPTIGTIRLGIDKEQFTVADIPGIIAGAAENKGMGLDFLRHIERSGGLVFVISLENEQPIEDLKLLLNEMGPKRLANKRMLIVATKADIENTRTKYIDLKNFVEGNNWKCVPCCAMKNENIERVLQMMYEATGKK